MRGQPTYDIPAYVFIAFYLGFIFLVFSSKWIISKIIAWKKRQALRDWASAHGFEIYRDSVLPLSRLMVRRDDLVESSEVAKKFTRMFHDFCPIGSGLDTSIWNAIVGAVPCGMFYSFDFAFTEGSDRQAFRFHYGIVAFRVPFDFLRLSFRGEGKSYHLPKSNAKHDIEYESDAFNKAYFVESDSEKFAFDILHPMTMDFLLQIPVMHWQMFGPYIVLVKERGWSINELESILGYVERFVELIPEYVREDFEIDPDWETPFEPISAIFENTEQPIES